MLPVFLRYGSGPYRDGSAGYGPSAGTGSGSGQDPAEPSGGQHQPETSHPDRRHRHPGQRPPHGTSGPVRVRGHHPWTNWKPQTHVKLLSPSSSSLSSSGSSDRPPGRPKPDQDGSVSVLHDYTGVSSVLTLYPPSSFVLIRHTVAFSVLSLCLSSPSVLLSLPLFSPCSHQ